MKYDAYSIQEQERSNMIYEHKIVEQVYAAKADMQAADELVRQYMPFIKSETAKFLNRAPVEGSDDELNIAMFAFHEAAMNYSRERGAFLSLAALSIRNRLIDYRRREKRHEGHISLDGTADGDDESRTLLEQLDSGSNEIEEMEMRRATKEEIIEFTEQLSEYGLKLTDIADNSPKQDRTLNACHKALAYARENQRLLNQLVETKKLPISALAEGSGVEKKTLERHRKYMVALLLAYTNGFEIIRGHLRRIAPQKGGR